jgi:hypothetical protein
MQYWGSSKVCGHILEGGQLTVCPAMHSLCLDLDSVRVEALQNEEMSCKGVQEVYRDCL